MVRFRDFDTGGTEPVLELEPDASDASVIEVIATLVKVHLSGQSAQAVDGFCGDGLLPMMAGLMVATLGADRACELFAGMPKFVREAQAFETARPTGPAH